MTHSHQPTAENQPSHDGGRSPSIPLVEALRVLADLRTNDQIVVTQMGSAREWPKLADHPLDFQFVPSTMGGGPSLGLGLALAQPNREVLVVSGDGSLLMNLGSLVTITGSSVKNLSIVLLDNGVYEVTGGQKTAAAEGCVDYAGMARAAGFPNVAQCQTLADWQRRAADVLHRPGPRFVWLTIEPMTDPEILRPTRPMAEQIERFTAALNA